jgi:hypothetical protein
MNTHSTSNAAEVHAWLLGAVSDFGFNSSVAGKRLGDAIVDNHVAQIQQRSFGEQRGAEQTWPQLTEPYASRKEELYGQRPINVATGQMLSQDSLHGEPMITDRVIEHRYGTGKAGEPAPKREGKRRRRSKPAVEREPPTDRQKAQWAEEKGRPFFELDDLIRDRNADLVADALAQHLRNR